MSAVWPWLRRVWPGVAAFMLLQVLFFVLVLVAMAVPNKPIARHLADSVATKDFAVTDRAPEPLEMGTADTFTECVALTMGLGRVGHSGLVYRTIADGHLGWCGPSRAALPSYDGSQPAVQEYIRYWHGYTVITRPLLAVMSVKPLRVVLWSLLAVAVALFFWSSGWRRWWLALGVLGPLLLTSDAVVLPLSIPHAIAWATALVGWVLVWRRGRWSLPMATALAGSLFAYVDLLTNPPAAWLLVVLAAAASRFTSDRRVPGALRAAAVGGAMWFVGFAATWGTKWLLDLDVFGWRTVREQVVDQIGLRASSSGVDDRWGLTTRDNFNTWLGSGVHEALVIVVLVAVAAAVALAGLRRQLRAALALSAPALIVPVWYEILKNHSQIHAFFTYRALPVACGVVIGAGLLAASLFDAEQDNRPKSPPRIRISD